MLEQWFVPSTESEQLSPAITIAGLFGGNVEVRIEPNIAIHVGT